MTFFQTIRNSKCRCPKNSKCLSCMRSENSGSTGHNNHGPYLFLYLFVIVLSERVSFYRYPWSMPPSKILWVSIPMLRSFIFLYNSARHLMHCIHISYSWEFLPVNSVDSLSIYGLKSTLWIAMCRVIESTPWSAVRLRRSSGPHPVTSIRISGIWTQVSPRTREYFSH